MKNQIHSQKVFSFSHWTRKSYAIFQSLKLQIRIASLAIGLILIPGFQELVAQEITHNEALEEYDLDTMEVLGELSPELAQNLSRSIQLINVPAISSLPLSSLQSALNSISQLDIRQRGPNDVQSDISLRASTFDQVQILLNGFDMTDPQTGHHSFNLPITFSQLQQVQILSGSGTRALGVNSYAGTINFVTRNPNTNKIELGANVGDFGLLDFDAALSLYKNKIRNYVFVNKSLSKGYTSNTDFSRYSIFYNGELDIKKSNIEWQAAFMDKAFGANNFYTPKFSNQFEQLRTAFAGIRYSTKGFISTSTSAHYRANADRFELFRYATETPSWYSNHNYHLSQVSQIKSRAWLWTKFGKSAFAANFRYESIYSNVLGLLISQQKPAIFDKSGFYNRFDERYYVSISMEQVYLWNNLKLAGGFMYYKILERKLSNQIYPGIDITYSFSDKLKLLGGINTGMRLPTFTDLYYSGPDNMGNPDLLPEKQTTYQLGLKYKDNSIIVAGNMFLNRAYNSIDWVRKNDTLKWQPINITEVEIFGGDIRVSYIPNKESKSILRWINEASITWAYNEKRTISPQYQSHYVMDYLKNKLAFTLNYKIVEGLSMGYVVRYQERVGKFLFYDSNSGISFSQDYKPFTLFDTKLSWENSSWNLYITVSNIFNVKYQDYGNVEQAGRWFKVGLRKTFML